jgi:uncharacterized protein (TIGR03790 family)
VFLAIPGLGFRVSDLLEMLGDGVSAEINASDFPELEPVDIRAWLLALIRALPLLCVVATILGFHSVEASAQFANNFANRNMAWPKVLHAAQVAVVVNSASPESIELGEYYLRVRHIPADNLIRVSISGSPKVLSAAAFAKLKQQIDAQLDAGIEAMLLVWTAPYAVECNSITAAMTMGFQAELCRKTCDRSQANVYFDAATSRPFSDHGMRLTMLLPTTSVALGKALIDRGVASDGNFPHGTGYFLNTSDDKRNSRARFFPSSGHLARPPMTLKTLNANSIEGQQDVMFYFTGAAWVPKLDTLKFLPGAVADHLTSAGGDLLGSSQMSSLRWLEAGATASYGSVSEPCNHWQKFPNPAVLLKHYLAGETVIEAYWKSVAWPGQGLFIGEPLAAPYRR